MTQLSMGNEISMRVAERSDFSVWRHRALEETSGKMIIEGRIAEGSDIHALSRT
jgi:hypothetical protein